MQPRTSSSQRGYGSKWRAARAGYLRSHPLCVMCQEHGSLTPASVVDHIVPHKGEQRLFWDRGNWQALCSHCHDSHKRRQEMSGTVLGSDAAGCPIDDAHHWNAPK